MTTRNNILSKLNCSVNLALKEQYLNLIQSIKKPSSAFFIVDEKLTSKLDVLSSVTELKERGISSVHYLSKFNFELVNKEDCLIFAIRPKLRSLEYIIKNLNLDNQQTDNNDLLLNVISIGAEDFELGKRCLQTFGCSSFINLHCLEVGALFIESDLLSSQSETAYRKLFINKDVSVLHELNKTIECLQKEINICSICTKGDYAKSINESLKSRYNEELSFDADMVVLDRSVDLTTCVLMQLTYKGLLHELNITSNSKSQYYNFMYDLNFSHIPSILKSEVSALNTQYESRHNAKSVDQIKSFVGKLGNLQDKHKQLSEHTTVSEEINKYIKTTEFEEILKAEQHIINNNEEEATETIQELIYSECKVDKALRLIMLQCLVYGGLKPATIDNYVNLICQTYGYHHMLTFLNMEESRVLTKRQNTHPSFFELDTVFDLNTVADVDNIEKIDSIYSGYVPLTIRLVQLSMKELTYIPKTGLNAITNKLAFANNRAQQNRPQWNEMNQQLAMIQGQQSHRIIDETEREKDIVIVVFVGGCTYSEVSLIRLMGKMYQKHMVIVTSGVITGSNIVKDFMEVN